MPISMRITSIGIVYSNGIDSSSNTKIRKILGSGCSTAVEHTPQTERLWVRILPGAGLFLFSISSVERSLSGHSCRCNTTEFPYLKNA